MMPLAPEHPIPHHLSIQHLPVEIVEKVLIHLPLPQIWRFRRLSTLFKLISESAFASKLRSHHGGSQQSTHSPSTKTTQSKGPPLFSLNLILLSSLGGPWFHVPCRLTNPLNSSSISGEEEEGLRRRRKGDGVEDMRSVRMRVGSVDPVSRTLNLVPDEADVWTPYDLVENDEGGEGGFYGGMSWKSTSEYRSLKECKARGKSTAWTKIVTLHRHASLKRHEWILKGLLRCHPGVDASGSKRVDPVLFASGPFTMISTETDLSRSNVGEIGRERRRREQYRSGSGLGGGSVDGVGMMDLDEGFDTPNSFTSEEEDGYTTRETNSRRSENTNNNNRCLVSSSITTFEMISQFTVCDLASSRPPSSSLGGPSTPPPEDVFSNVGNPLLDSPHVNETPLEVRIDGIKISYSYLFSALCASPHRKSDQATYSFFHQLPNSNPSSSLRDSLRAHPRSSFGELSATGHSCSTSTARSLQMQPLHTGLKPVHSHHPHSHHHAFTSTYPFHSPLRHTATPPSSPPHHQKTAHTPNNPGNYSKSIPISLENKISVFPSRFVALLTTLASQKGLTWSGSYWSFDIVLHWLSRVSQEPLNEAGLEESAEEVVEYLVEYERVMEDSKRKRMMARHAMMRYYPSP
ncbi:hypothetical protein HDV05_007863 [Chytridiales sp. JEL 0842]|nr:hypothetical protein HDV05_007863 [Chytridiales sp. JEL 0842]